MAKAGRGKGKEEEEEEKKHFRPDVMCIAESGFRFAFRRRGDRRQRWRHGARIAAATFTRASLFVLHDGLSNLT